MGGGQDAESASRTQTRKPQDAVGEPGSAPAGGGRQTAEQAAVTDMGGGGLSDAERPDHPAGGEPGRSPPTPGGSSAGHSDRKASQGPREDETVAAGGAKAEREKAEREKAERETGGGR